MILETMTLDEVLHLLKVDLLQFTNKFHHDYQEFKMKTRKFQNRSRIWHNPREYKTKNGFNFVTLFFSEPVSFPKEERLRFLYYCWFIIKGKIYVFNLSYINRSLGHLKIFSSHFIERYCERHLKQPTLSKLDGFKAFVQSNLKGSFCGCPSDGHPDGFCEIVNDGIIYGDHTFNKELNCRVSFMRTFISWDMIGQDQRQIAMEGKVTLQSMGVDLTVPEDDFLPLFGNAKNGIFIETSRIADSIELIKKSGADKKMSTDNLKGIF